MEKEVFCTFANIFNECFKNTPILDYFFGAVIIFVMTTLVISAIGVLIMSAFALNRGN
jgi:hypothetical protein